MSWRWRMGDGTTAGELLSSQLVNERERIGVRRNRRLCRDSDTVWSLDATCRRYNWLMFACFFSLLLVCSLQQPCVQERSADCSPSAVAVGIKFPSVLVFQMGLNWPLFGGNCCSFLQISVLAVFLQKRCGGWRAHAHTHPVPPPRNERVQLSGPASSSPRPQETSKPRKVHLYFT